jgi:alpha-1,6-mannosyltransferase
MGGAEPESTAPAAAWPRAAVAALLATSAALLAVAGAALVPAAGPDAPRWILGVFGEGLSLSPGLFLALLYVAIAAWATLYFLCRPLEPRATAVLIGVLVTIFTLAPPLLSLDVFSYISYARLAAEGLDPYEHAPAALGADPAASRVEDFRFATSVYGPLFVAATYPLGFAGVGFALWALKLLAGLAVAVIALLTARIARLRGLAAAPAAAFVALNPLVLVHVVGGAHNDGLMVAVALLAVLWALTARPAAAGAALAATAAIKASGALYAPFALAGSRRRGRLLAGLAGAAALLGGAGLLLFGPDLVGAFGAAGENQGTVSRWSVPATLSRILGADVDAVRALLAASYVAAVIALLVWTARGGDWVRAAGWAALGLLVATAWLTPWYLIWLLPLAAVSRDRPLLVATALLTAFQAINAVPV